MATRKGSLEQEEVAINCNLALYKSYGFYKMEAGANSKEGGPASCF